MKEETTLDYLQNLFNDSLPATWHKKFKHSEDFLVLKPFSKIKKKYSFLGRVLNRVSPANILFEMSEFFERGADIAIMGMLKKEDFRPKAHDIFQWNPKFTKLATRIKNWSPGLRSSYLSESYTKEELAEEYSELLNSLTFTHIIWQRGIKRYKQVLDYNNYNSRLTKLWFTPLQLQTVHALTEVARCISKDLARIHGYLATKTNFREALKNRS